MKKFISILTILFTMLSVHAANVADDALYVWTSPTEYTCYLFTETPSIDVDNEYMVINVNDKEVKRIDLASVSDVQITTGIKYPTVKLNSMGYATLSFKADMQLSSDCMKAYTAKVVDGKIVCSEIADGIIPAGNGVLLIGEASATAQLEEATSDMEMLADNDLLATTLSGGSLAAVPETGYTFVLKGSQFHPYASNTFTADKAYFNLSFNPIETSLAKMMNIMLDTDEAETATSVMRIGSQEHNINNVYDIQGRRVINHGKGIYIVNGKKVMLQ